jgi:hypothetical protein
MAGFGGGDGAESFGAGAFGTDAWQPTYLSAPQ